MAPIVARRGPRDERRSTFRHGKAYIPGFPTDRVTVTRLRRLVPAGNLGRIRLVATLIGCSGLGADLCQIGNEGRSPGWHAAAFASILLIGVAVLVTSVRGRAPWWLSFGLPVLTVIGGAGLRDPLATIGMAFSVALPLSLYGHRTSLWIVRTVGCALAVPAAVAISPMSLGRTIAWDSSTAIGMLPPVLLMGAMMRGIYLAMMHQLRASARDAVVARTGSLMISQTEAAQVRRLGIEAADEIIALTPGTALAVLRRDESGLVVANLAGLPEELRGRTVPGPVLDEPGTFRALAPQYRHWRIEAFSAEGYLLVGGVRPVHDDIVAALRTVANQVLLGEAACRSHAELEHRAHHDQLTGLPTRDKFFRELGAAAATGTPGSVALLLIDLDGFKGVNDTYGHATGDELLVALAERIGPAGGPGSVPARLGGDEFALLLTGLTGPGDAERTARMLCARLAAPARLTDVTVTVGASIGIAPATPGVGADELTRRADLAMYAAKAQGRNRAEFFDPDRHDERRRARGRLLRA
jgi:diguanylate cyclase (GGDEF)-like protein